MSVRQMTHIFFRFRILLVNRWVGLEKGVACIGVTVLD